MQLVVENDLSLLKPLLEAQEIGNDGCRVTVPMVLERLIIFKCSSHHPILPPRVLEEAWEGFT